MMTVADLPARVRGRKKRRSGALRRFGKWTAQKVVAVPLTLVAVVLTLVWAILRRLGVSLDVVFAVYGTASDRSWFLVAESLKWLLPPIVPIGLLRYRGRWGLIGANFRLTAEEMRDGERDAVAAKAANQLPLILRQFPRVSAVALAGRWPGLVLRAGRELHAPFVDGVFGTRYAMLTAAFAAVKKCGVVSPKDVTVAILGGAGRIGSQVIGDLATCFRQVVAYDPSYASGERMLGEGNVLRTSDPCRLAVAEVVIVLTAEGDQISTIVPFLAPGTIVVDDTHPPIHRPIRRAMRDRGVQLYKVVVVDGHLKMFPRLPNFQAGNIPGCLLEAVVVSLVGRKVLEGSASRFFEAAHELGYRAELIEHPDDS